MPLIDLGLDDSLHKVPEEKQALLNRIETEFARLIAEGWTAKDLMFLGEMLSSPEHWNVPLKLPDKTTEP